MNHSNKEKLVDAAFFLIYTVILTFYSTGKLNPNALKAINDAGDYIFFWTTQSQQAEFFRLAIIASFSLNALCLIAKNFIKNWHTPYENNKSTCKYLFVRSFFWTMIFIFLVYIFTSKITAPNNHTNLDYFYQAAIALVLSGILNIWFDFFASFLSLHRR